MMTANRQSGTSDAPKAKTWIIVSDAVGLAILLAASGSAALNHWMFVLLTCVPVAASFMLLAPPSRASASTAISGARPPVRKVCITISPHVTEWQAYRDG